MSGLSKAGRYVVRKLREIAEGPGVKALVQHHREFILRTYQDLISRGISPDEALLATFRATLRHAL